MPPKTQQERPQQEPAQEKPRRTKPRRRNPQQEARHEDPTQEKPTRKKPRRRKSRQHAQQESKQGEPMQETPKLMPDTKQQRQKSKVSVLLAEHRPSPARARAPSAIEAPCASEKASTAESKGGAETNRTGHVSVGGKNVFLRHGVDSSFTDVSNALERTSQRDLVHRPALLIALVHVMLATVDPSLIPTRPKSFVIPSPTLVYEQLACAGSVLKLLLSTVELLLRKQLSLPRDALISCDQMLAAALCLRAEIHRIIKEWNAPSVQLCEWEQRVLGNRRCSDEERMAGVVWKRPAKRLATKPAMKPGTKPATATKPARKRTAADDDEEVDAEAAARTPARPVPAAVQVVFDALQSAAPASGHTSDAGVADRSLPLGHPTPRAGPPSFTQILPSGLARGLPESCRGLLRNFHEQSFEWEIGDELPELFKVEHWRCRVFLCPKADAAAKKVTAALVNIQSPPPAEAYPADVTPGLRKLFDSLNQKLTAQRLVTAVNCGKQAYCAALTEAIRYADTLARLAQATFVDCMAPGRSVSEADKQASFKRTTTDRVSGSCPLRAAISATLAATGKFKLPRQRAPVGKQLSHAERIQEQGAEKDLGKVFEKKAHIIPLAAASCSRTPMLLYKVDGSNPPECGLELLDYLASPHNTFYLSSCFKPFFDSGAFVFVKIGPPECQFYRVTTTEKAEAAVIDFGADVEMRWLFRHMGSAAAVPLSCIDGLVVDLARPAKVISCDGAEIEMLRVSQRYMDLHASTHYPSHRKAPHINHNHALTDKSLEMLETRYDDALDEAAIEDWLERVDPQS